MEMYTREQMDIIKKDLEVVLKSDYSPPKRLKFYKDKEVPMIWGISNLLNYKIPNFKTVYIKDLVSDIKLKPLQEECMKEIDVQMNRSYGGGIINLSTGSGKTVLSLFTIAKYRLKTLIIVNTVELMNQWKESIRKFLGNVDIGTIRGDTFDKDCDITIGMLQTISMRKEYKKDLFRDFTLCFIDECHHLSSEVFSEALFKCRTKYTFGLSATVTRRDGLEFVFRYHLGDVIFSDSLMKGTKQKSIIKKMQFKGDSSIERNLYNGKPKISTMITEISRDVARNEMIVKELLSLDCDRRVLVLSDRLDQLDTLHGKLGDKLSGIFTGKTPKEVKDTTKTKKIMLATYNIASEGFDHPVLNTILFATPRANVTQSIGRIYRKVHDVTPLIIDIVDDFSIFPYQYRKRLSIYNQQLGRKEQEEQQLCLFD